MLEQVISSKAGWVRVAFGDVVRLSKERAKDPEAEGYERVVGLEHIDPGDLRIRRWADIAGGTTFTSVFKPGQVLFGKRRAYQRKVAVADFTGVCSGDIYVLEPSSDVLMPELLPFICQTDAFFDHAIGTSAGSLSPRTNWKGLSSFDLLLPPIEKQHRILRYFQAAQSVSDYLRQLHQSGETLFQSLMEELFRRGIAYDEYQTVDGVKYPKSWPLRALGELASVERGKFSHRPRNLPEFFGGPYPFIQVTEIANSTGTLVLGTGSLSEEGVQYSRSFPPGTVLISITGVVLAKTAITEREVWVPDSIVGIQPGPELDARFLEFCLRRLHKKFNKTLASVSTTQKNINLETLRPLQIPCPNTDIQLEVVRQLTAIQQALFDFSVRAKEADAIRDRVVREVLLS